MNILIIGGAGYIGSVVTNKLISKNSNIYIYDNLSTGFKQGINKNATFIRGDILDYKKLCKTIKINKINIIISLAAKLIVPESVEKPIEYFDENINGIINVLKAMKENKVDKIIFSSTAAVYGSEFKKEICENSKKNPMNPYGQSKLSCEWLIESASKIANINYVIFRFFNVAGASDNIKFGSFKKHPTALIPCINKAILEKKEIKIFGNKYKTKDGTCLRDYVHVEDLASAHELAISYLNKKKSGIFNLGSNKGYTNLDVIKEAKKTIDKNITYKIEKPRSGDPDSLLTSNKKALLELKWKPKKTLSNMLETDFKFRKKNLYK